MNEPQNFLNDLMKHILEGTKIPKVQVERAIKKVRNIINYLLCNLQYQSIILYNVLPLYYF